MQLNGTELTPDLAETIIHTHGEERCIGGTCNCEACITSKAFLAGIEWSKKK